MANLSQTLCMCLCMFIGSFIRGLTSLGTGIIFYTLWVVLITFGLDAGTLRQIVPSLLISQGIGSLALLYLFNGNKYGDWGISFAILIPSNIFCIFGSLVLNYVALWKLEAGLAFCLLFIVSVRGIQLIGSCLEARRKRIETKSKSLSNHDDDLTMPLNNNDDEEKLLDEKPQAISKSEEDDNSPKQIGWKHQLNRALIGTRDGLVHSGWVFLLIFTGQVKFEKEDRNNNYTKFNIVASDKSCVYNRILVIVYTDLFLRNLPWFILCGILSGFFGCAVGLPGPPIFVMFQMLNFDRDEARVIFTLVALFTFRPLVFLFDGGLRMEDATLYVYTFIAMCVGVLTGFPLSNKLPIKWFKAFLDIMVVLSMILMFLKVLNLTPEV